MNTLAGKRPHLLSGLQFKRVGRLAWAMLFYCSATATKEMFLVQCSIEKSLEIFHLCLILKLGHKEETRMRVHTRSNFTPSFAATKT